MIPQNFFQLGCRHITVTALKFVSRSPKEASNLERYPARTREVHRYRFEQ
jgi:hypothetical protein